MPTPTATLAPPLPKACAPAMPPAPALSAVVVDNAGSLPEHVAAWGELTTAALEPNVFYEPWALLPAVHAFGGGVKLQFVLIYASLPNAPPLLCGVFPVERLRRCWGLPLSVARLWQHKHCFLGTPLLRTSHAPAALAAFLDWVAGSGNSLLQLPLAPANGAFAQLLADLCEQRGLQVLSTDRHERGMLVPGDDADAYLQTAISGSSRRAMKRRHRRLAETGHLQCDIREPSEDATAWIDDFLRLEATGWKGQLGTALAANAAEAAFFRTIAVEAARRRRLLTLALRLDGRAIGCRCAFLAGDGAFAFKSAYDEAFAAFSPGLILELENIRQCHALPSLRWMDSCSSPDNDMINRLWQDRRALQTVTVATGRTGTVAITMLHLLQRLRRRWRGN